MINEKEKVHKTVFTNTEITPLLFDLYSALVEIKNIKEVDSVYIHKAMYNLEIYIFYEQENFDIEDKITRAITEFETDYKYFPEVFIHPLDMIERKELVLPEDAKAI